MATFLVFAGTSEGRRLVELLSGCGAEVCASVATEYGKTLLPRGVKVFSERLDADGMSTLLQSLRFDCVIDATHPYAARATENIRAACAATGTRYLRLLRPSVSGDGCVYVESAAQAAEVLTAATGNVLLTTGSKELDAFVRVPDYQERIYPRVLPSLESVQRCLALGYRVQNILAMQGPFTREMNGATLRQIGASILVTKESGDAGGFSEKLDAARDTGAIAVVIGRPREERGLSFDEVVEALSADFPLRPAPQEAKPAPRFPLFFDLTGRKIALFGGGPAALERAKALVPFGARLTVISPQPAPELEAMAVQVLRRPYRQGDCAGFDLVLAASGNRELNLAVHEEAKSLGVPDSVLSEPALGAFLFPEVFVRGALCVGAAGPDPEEERAARELRKKLEQWDAGEAQ